MLTSLLHVVWAVGYKYQEIRVLLLHVSRPGVVHTSELVKFFVIWLKHLPNMLSLSRIPLGVVVYHGIVAHSAPLALGCVLYALISDFLDGMIARAYGLNNGIGVLLDTLSDKLFLIGLYLGLAAVHQQYFVLLTLVAAKEVAMILCCGALWLGGCNIATFKSVWVGKVALVVNMAAGLAIALDFAAFPALLASVFASGAAIVYYFLRVCRIV